jgi:hypothetical protein
MVTASLKCAFTIGLRFVQSLRLEHFSQSSVLCYDQLLTYMLRGNEPASSMRVAWLVVDCVSPVLQKTIPDQSTEPNRQAPVRTPKATNTHTKRSTRSQTQQKTQPTRTQGLVSSEPLPLALCVFRGSGVVKLLHISSQRSTGLIILRYVQSLRLEHFSQGDVLRQVREVALAVLARIEQGLFQPNGSATKTITGIRTRLKSLGLL